MAKKYICQLRRGTRYVDEHGATLLNEDGTPVRDDWGTYTTQDDHVNPLDGELVVEFEYNPVTGKKTPRFKLGYDDNIFADLEYISPDSFILPKPITIKLNGGLKTEDNPDGWALAGDGRFVQEITSQLVGKVTLNSMVDLQPTPDMLAQFHLKDVAFTTVNEDGRIYVYAIGTMPQNTYENLQISITEVVTNV